MPTNITISIRDDLHRRTRVKAAEYNVSISTFVASILEVYFQKSDARAKRLGTPPAPGSAQPTSAIPAKAPIRPNGPAAGDNDESVRIMSEIVAILGERRVQEITGMSFDGTQLTPVSAATSTAGTGFAPPPPPPRTILRTREGGSDH